MWRAQEALSLSFLWTLSFAWLDGLKRIVLITKWSFPFKLDGLWFGSEYILYLLWWFNFAYLFQQPNIPNLLMSNNVVCGNMYRICYNNMPKQRIWVQWNSVFSPCACPLPGWNYAGSSKQLLLSLQQLTLGLWKAF